MENIKILEEELDELQMKLQIIKKKSMTEECFLHSGEMLVIKFIAKYHYKYGTAPTLVKASQEIGISGATVTTLVDRLIKKGLIEKEASADDKRSKILSLTKKGKEYLMLNRSRTKERLSKVIASIGKKDTKELSRIIKKINNQLDNIE
ncbi:MAG: MarR family transcriptional regulator [bacterium]